MAFRCIMIENPAHIAVRNGQLIIRTEAEHSAALEDISAILLESRQSVITTAALSQLGQCGCAVYVCDEKHMPCAVMTPFHQYVRELSVWKSQMNLSEPRKKRLWQEIVTEKIKNQAKCLELTGHADKADVLNRMATNVRSGDTGNVEATAAQTFFPSLFGPDFTREDDCGWNAGLNYGYAVLRGYVARTLAVYGFHPALGLHHCSTLNSFNLADDLMEPFRPVIDLLVFRNIEKSAALIPAHKRMLFNCLNLDILSGGQHHSVSYAIEREVQSLRKAIDDKNSGLVLPQLLETKQHMYE